MTDIEQALAEALRGMVRWGIECEADYYGSGQDDEAYIERPARAVLALEPMQAIARQAAIGAAVERLGDDWWVEHGNGRYSVTVLRGGVPMGFPADTLDAAIAAALGDDDD